MRRLPERRERKEDDAQHQIARARVRTLIAANSVPIASQFVHVKCGQHEEGHGCFVCAHIVRGEGEGWFSSERPGDPWPDAWCGACEAICQSSGGWTDDSQLAADIRLVCHHCYEAKRDARW